MQGPDQPPVTPPVPPAGDMPPKPEDKPAEGGEQPPAAQ